MKKEFTVNERTYTIEDCTAICMCDLEEENPELNRQNALLVTSVVNGEKFTDVVFGYDMPENNNDFLEMSEDYDAWESPNEVVATVFTDLRAEAESLAVDAANFKTLRDVFEYNHKREEFILYLSDKQILKIEETSDNYEFDEMIGLIDEIENRSDIEQPEYDSEDGDENHERFEKWYRAAVEELKRNAQ